MRGRKKLHSIITNFPLSRDNCRLRPLRADGHPVDTSEERGRRRKERRGVVEGGETADGVMPRGADSHKGASGGGGGSGETEAAERQLKYEP